MGAYLRGLAAKMAKKDQKVGYVFEKNGANFGLHKVFQNFFRLLIECRF